MPAAARGASDMITFGSLFSGIGGFDLGFEQAGMECAWQCEIDNAARSVLARHWPGVPCMEDVRDVRSDNVAAVDLICGGFPCQDVSVAGKRAGLAGDRSGLWFEFHRVVEELRPKWVVVENVPGLLSSNGGADFAVIVRGLVECGYGVSWRVLDAQYFGVAQRRRRVFIVGSLGDGRSAQVLFEREGLFGHPPARRAQGQGTTRDIAPSLAASGRGTERSGESRGQDPLVVAFDWQSGGDVRHNISEHHTSALQANQTPAVAFTQNTREEVRQIGGDGSVAGALSAETGMHQTTYVYQEQGGFGVREFDGVVPTLQAEGGTHQGGPGYLPLVFGGNNTSGAIEIAAAVNAHGGSGRMDFESETFVAFQSSQSGVREVDQHATLDSNNGSRRHNGVAGASGVRRLTPTECERLQGFPDGHTAGQSDSARYRQLGNAVAVPVARWIGERIVSL